jgi:hypothetical protein
VRENVLLFFSIGVYPGLRIRAGMNKTRLLRGSLKVCPRGITSWAAEKP